MDLLPRPTVVPALPRALYVETTNRCDSKCQTCIRTFQTLEPPKDLTLAELRAIVDQFPVLDRVTLNGIGEPLLNRELFAMVSYLKAKGTAVAFNSDAIGLTARKAAALLDAAPDEYRVSMDAATPETYRAVRGVDQFDRVVANVARLAALKAERGAATPRLSLWFTAMRVNLEELPAFVDLAARLGVPEVHVQRLVFYGDGLAVAEQSLHGQLQAREASLLEEAERRAEAAGIDLHASGLTTPTKSLAGAADGTPRPWAGCQRPWTLSYVTANGNVLPCCIAPWTARRYREALLGNALQEPFAEIWNGTPYQQFRKTFESDVPPDPCRGCGMLWSL